MDFFSLPHQKHPTVTEDEDVVTDLFAKAIDDRFNTAALLPSSSSATNNNRITPLSLSLSSVPRNSLPSPHFSSRSHSHHLPASSPYAALFTPLSPANLLPILSDPHTLVLDIRPLPAYLASRIPHAVPLSVPSTLLKRPLFSTSKLAEMLPNRSARRKFSQWRLAKRILVYDADSAILPEGSNVLGLLRKFRAEAGLSADPQPSGAPPSPGELQLGWLKGGFQAVFREHQSLLEFNPASDDDDDEDTPSPPSFADPDYHRNSEPLDPTYMSSRQMTLSIPTAIRPTLLRTKHLPMSAFTASSTTSQRSGSVRHKPYLGQQPGTRDFITVDPTAGGPASTRAESSVSLSGSVAVPQSTSNPGPNVAFNPFYDTIRQNTELSHGITERIPLRISRIAKDRINDLPFTWLRELGGWAGVDDEGTDGEDNFEGESGSGSGSGISGDDHSGMSSDSGEEDSGMAHTISPTNHAVTTPEDAQAEGSEALAMQFYRIELGEQRRLMGVMEHHSKESGRIMEAGETKGHKSKSKKRSKQRSKVTGRSSRGKHGSRDFPYSITAGVEKGAKNRYRNIWPFEHARVRLQKQKLGRGKPPTPPSNSTSGPLHPITLPQPTDFLPPVLSLPSTRSIQLPLNTPAASSSADDYVNASYVQPIGTKRRYIATQGPLPETFNDFWLLVWEQNVHVIVMLTREVEGSTVKCGNYWSGEKFGPLRVKMLEVTGALEEYEKSDSRAPGDPFFPPMSKAPTTPSETGPGPVKGDGSFPQSTIKRVLELSHTGFSHLPPRRVVQFQYLDWPDLNVPNDTRSILELIREVEREVELGEENRGSWEGPRQPDDWRGGAMIGTVRPRRSTLRNSREVSPSGSGSRSSGSGSGASSPSLDAIDSDTGIMKRALGERPVLLHCSAGVGRTGGFIAIDAVLDGVRREMRKRREGRLTGATRGDDQISRSRSGRDTAERNGRTSGSSTSEKDRTSSGDEVAAMDVDEPSAGGRAPPVPGLVMKLPAEDHKAVVHVPVVGMIPPSSTRPLGKEGALSYAASMDVDATSLAALSPWAAASARDKLQAWIPNQPGPPSSPSSCSAHESRPPASSSESVRSTVPQALSRSLSPSGDSALSDISALSLPLSVNSTRSLSHSSPEANSISPRQRTFNSLATAVGAQLPIRMSSVPTAAPLNIAPSSASSASAARVSGSSVPPDTEIGSDSSRGRSTGASSLLSSGTKSGSFQTLPTDPSLMDLSSVIKTDSESLRFPLSGVSARKSESKSSESPPANEDSPPANGSDPYYSQSQSQSEHSPPAFDYTLPRQLHDDRHSPVLLSTIDEPIHRVIEDMREQRMSLCQSLRQYVFVHRAVIEGVLTLVDEERALYGTTWKDSDLEELSTFVAVRFPITPTKQVTTSESGSVQNAGNAAMSVGSAADTGGSGPTGSVASVSGNSGSEGCKFGMEVSPIKGKRRASPTELPKEDKRGDTRMSKRPSMKRSLRSSDGYSPDGDCAMGTRRVEDVALTPLATR
ncbi:hypothetical protein BJV74DRAFT_880678 [Russula compacta]|nr:hypothetical protein BJV74DRAFT_880678 [Russula compacta]